MTEREQILFDRLKALVELISTVQNVYGTSAGVRRVTQWMMDQDSFKTAANTIASTEELLA